MAEALTESIRMAVSQGECDEGHDHLSRSLSQLPGKHYHDFFHMALLSYSHGTSRADHSILIGWYEREGQNKEPGDEGSTGRKHR